MDQKIAEVSKGETVCEEVVWASLFYFVCLANGRFCSRVCPSSARTGGGSTAADQDGRTSAGLQGLFMLILLSIPSIFIMLLFP